MNLESQSYSDQDKSFHLVRDSFWVSSGSTIAHALFARYIAVSRGIKALEALNLINQSYFSLDQEHRQKLIHEMQLAHKLETKQQVDTNLLRNLNPALRQKVIFGEMNIEDFYQEDLEQKQLLSPSYLEDLKLLISELSIVKIEELDLALKYVSMNYHGNAVLTALKNIAAYIGIFNEKLWFKRLSEKQQLALKLKGEKIFSACL